MTVHEYIISNWKHSIRTHSHARDEIVLPYLYTSPCSEGIFDDFYYWDTYFLNKGLIADGNLEQVKNNILNYCFLIDLLGFIPNANRMSMTSRSQPPFFILMIKDYFQASKDTITLQNSIIYALKEYNFWMNNKEICINNCLLNYYKNATPSQYIDAVYDEYLGRVKHIENTNLPKEIIANHSLGECESGWDFSPRFGQRSQDFLPLDLNSLMYINEVTLVNFIREFNIDVKYDYILNNAAKRQHLIKNIFLSKDIYYDYDYKNNQVSDVISAASFAPFAFEIDNNKERYMKIYEKLNFEYGISSGENKSYKANYQWFYPNCWPPLTYIAFLGAINSNNQTIAKEIAIKYCRMIENEFRITKALWEKYDVNTNRKSSVLEYSETKMLGWTAGVYEVMFKYLKEGKII